MSERPRIEEIRSIAQEMKEEILRGQRESAILITEKMDRDKSEIIATIFSESRKTREKIGYQTMMLKTLEDNLHELQFDEDTGVSSKIEVSVGGEIFGTGAKWVLDIDTGKASYTEMLEAIQLLPGPNKIKEKAKSKLQKLLKRK